MPVALRAYSQIDVIVQASSDHTALGAPCDRNDTPRLSARSGVHADRQALAIVHEDLHHAAIHEHAQLEALAGLERFSASCYVMLTRHR